MPFAAALSEHPVPAHAVGEVTGAVLEALGAAPDVAVMFVTASHTGALDDMARAVRAVLSPSVFTGCAAASVLAGPREVEDSPAVSLWAAKFTSATSRPRPALLDAFAGTERLILAGLPDDVPPGSSLVLLADPFSFPAQEALTTLACDHPSLTVVGGLASSARGPGGNRLLLDDRVVDDGAVGVLFGPGTMSTTVVSQGCRPIGEPWVVTRSERNVIYELGGRPALDRLMDLIGDLSDADRRLAARGLHIGRVVDESKLDYERGDFLIRSVLGADKEVGAVAVGESLEVGATVQFQVRDAHSADDDLRALLAHVAVDAALVFTCNGRGTQLFGEPHHDAGLVASVVRGGATAGMFCAGEIGPVGGQSFLHGFTASVALFED